jgi:hypothetical protein
MIPLLSDRHCEAQLLAPKQSQLIVVEIASPLRGSQ